MKIYKKLFENLEQDFIKRNINSGLAIKQKGRWGTYHWRINPKKDPREKGNYQLINIIAGDTEEEVLKLYYKKYIMNKNN